MNSPSRSAPFSIRIAHQSDLPGLTEVLAHSFHSQEGWLGLLYPLFKIGIYEDLRQRLRPKHPRYTCLVAVEQMSSLECKRSLSTGSPSLPALSRPIAGTVEMGLRSQLLWQPQNQHYLYISNLAVETAYRRQGVALQLLRACEQIAVDWGYQELYLHVLENNHAARRLYQKAGYQVKSVETSLGSFLMGHPRQLFLQKSLIPDPTRPPIEISQ